MVLSDGQIIERIRKESMVMYALVEAKEEGVIPGGVFSNGYYLRCGYTFYVFKHRRYISPKRVYAVDEELPRYVLDPKNPNTDLIETVVCEKGDRFILRSGEYALVPSIEYMKMPRDIMGIILGQTTYARSGLVTNPSSINSEWQGYLTIELSNPTPLDIPIYPGEGICKCVFLTIDDGVLHSYRERGGVYNYQEASDVLPKVK